MAPIQYLIDHFMIPFLQFSYQNIFPNYAIAIILLTILLKLLLYPLTYKQFISMKNMQALQPQFKVVREKYKKNPQQMQQELVKLYKEHNVNPLGGCLPTLVQLPFLFALFYTMTSDLFKDMINPAIHPDVFPGLTTFWLPNLSAPDHFYILPIIIGLATYLSQKTTPMAMDSPHTKFLVFMPVIMVFICLKMPSGVLLYWASSQIISTIQQYFIMKKS